MGCERGLMLKFHPTDEGSMASEEPLQSWEGDRVGEMGRDIDAKAGMAGGGGGGGV